MGKKTFVRETEDERAKGDIMAMLSTHGKQKEWAWLANAARSTGR